MFASLIRLKIGLIFFLCANGKSKFKLKLKPVLLLVFVQHFLRATAVPAGTAEARISYENSVCLSVCHDPVVYQAQVR